MRFLKNYATVRQQRVVLSGCSSSWHNVTAGVLQGSVLGLLLFIYINDFSGEIVSSCKIFSGDTSLLVNGLFNGKRSDPDPIKQDIEACF